MHVYNETMIETYLDTIAQSRSGLATPPRTPISILLDFSGSMHLYQKKAEQVVQAITTQMLGINRRVFTLVIILIYNGQSEVVYLGDLHAFDIEQWLTSLPEKCYGKSPLATSIKAADQLLSRVKSACDLSGQICTVPFYFVISDALTTEDPPIYQQIIRKLSDDLVNHAKIIIECVRTDVQNGLDFGGYRLALDGPKTLSQLSRCIRAMRQASSTEAAATKEMSGQVIRPHKQDREAYGRYLSEVLIANMMFFFSQNREG